MCRCARFVLPSGQLDFINGFANLELQTTRLAGGSDAEPTFTVLETVLTRFPSAMTLVVPACSVALGFAVHALLQRSSSPDLCVACVRARVCLLAAWAFVVLRCGALWHRGQPCVRGVWSVGVCFGRPAGGGGCVPAAAACGWCLRVGLAGTRGAVPAAWACVCYRGWGAGGFAGVCVSVVRVSGWCPWA